MAGQGGFFEGFGKTFGPALQKGMQERKLREQFELEDEREKARMRQQQEQFERTQSLQEREFEALQEFRTKEAERAQKQAEIQARLAEVEYAKGFEKAFDPKTPPAYRKYLLRSMARGQGVDTNSAEFKDFEEFIKNSEAEEIESLRTVIGGMLPSLGPGQIYAMSKAVFSGQLPMSELNKLSEELRKDKNVKDILGGGGAVAVGAQPADGVDIFEGAPAELGEGAAQPPSMEPDISGTERDLEDFGNHPLADEEGAAEPEVKPDLLAERRAEIEATKKRRDAFQAAGLLDHARLEEQKLDDLMKAGEFEPELRGAIKGAELSAEEKQKWEQPVNSGSLRVVGLDPQLQLTRREARQLGIDVEALDDPKTRKEINTQKAAVHSSIKQIDELSKMITPAAIGPVGTLVRNADSLMEQAMAIQDITGISSAKFKRTVGKDFLRGLPETSAVIKSRVIDLAYTMAVAKDSGRLSDQDIQRFREQLGESGSAQQFITVLQDMKDRLRSGTAKQVEGLTGVVPFDLMTTSELIENARQTKDATLLGAIKRETERRLKEFSGG